MNRLEASIEARRRWGQNSIIESRPPSRARYSGGCLCGQKSCSGGRWLYSVGEGYSGGFLIQGRGHSWDEAFDEADPRTKSAGWRTALILQHEDPR